VIGLGGWNEAQCSPEPRDAVTGLAPDHGIIIEIGGRVRMQVELEEFGVLGRRGRRSRQPQGACHHPGFTGWRFREHTEGAEELHQRTTSTGRRYTSLAGLSGRSIQYGRRVPSGE
jgi:hypothetical protein